jgi:hypothetical protein
MTKEQKIEWMKEWAEKENLVLTLEGECGICRPCVGVLDKEMGHYPDYIWYDEDYENRIDDNGDVWIPELAYHKHPCVAVLEQDDESIDQLYDWLKWFSKNNFHYVKRERPECNSEIEILMGENWVYRMEKRKD